jgi:prepilin-type N-terminal cleavage/methylation domain-containing protein
VNENGLTLIELLVAMTIAGITLAAGYGMLTTLLDNREHLHDASERAARTAAVRHSLISWLEGAQVTRDANGPRYRGIDGVHDDRPDDELTFLTSAHTPLGSSETIVRLFIDRDEETAEVGLTAQFTEYLGVRSVTVELAPEIRGLDAEYFSRVLGADRWMPSWISASVLPVAVRLTLSPGDGDGHELPGLLRLPIVVPTVAAL